MRSTSSDSMVAVNSQGVSSFLFFVELNVPTMLSVKRMPGFRFAKAALSVKKQFPRHVNTLHDKIYSSNLSEHVI